MRLTLILLILNCLPSFAQNVEPPKVKLPETKKPPTIHSIIDFIQCPAEFPGGLDSMKRHIQNYHHDGWSDQESSKHGYVSFIVEPDGSLMEIQVIRGISLELDDLMLRIIEEMPKWVPACGRNGPVRSSVRLPITFEKPNE